jgi:hypothetical protein
MTMCRVYLVTLNAEGIEDLPLGEVQYDGTYIDYFARDDRFYMDSSSLQNTRERIPAEERLRLSPILFSPLNKSCESGQGNKDDKQEGKEVRRYE